MTQVNFLCIANHNIGGHFIDWSLAYVTGQHKYYNGNSVCQLTDVTASAGINWHHHKSYQIKKISDFDSLPRYQDLDYS